MTALRFTQQDLGVEVGAAQGTYSGAPSSRTYQVIYHGLSATAQLYINGTAISPYASQSAIPAGNNGAVWDAAKNLLNVYVASRPVDGTFRISTGSGVTGTGGASGGTGGTSGSGGSGGSGGSAGRGGAGSGGAGASTGGAGGVGGSGGASTGGAGGGAGGGTGGNGAGGNGAGGSGAGGSGAGGSGAGGNGGNSSAGSGGGPGGGGGSTSPVVGGGSSGCSCDMGTAVRSDRATQMVALLVAAVVGLSMRRRRSDRRRAQTVELAKGAR